MLTKYLLANCGYVGKIEQMLHYEDLINARDENASTKLQHLTSNSKTVPNKILRHVHTNEHQRKNDG